MGLTAIPQGIAYAIVAGLPAQVGTRYERTCDCVLAAYGSPSANDIQIQAVVKFQHFNVIDSSPKITQSINCSTRDKIETLRNSVSVYTYLQL